MKHKNYFSGNSDGRDPGNVTDTGNIIDRLDPNILDHEREYISHGNGMSDLELDDLMKSHGIESNDAETARFRKSISSSVYDKTSRSQNNLSSKQQELELYKDERTRPHGRSRSYKFAIANAALAACTLVIALSMAMILDERLSDNNEILQASIVSDRNNQLDEIRALIDVAVADKTITENFIFNAKPDDYYGLVNTAEGINISWKKSVFDQLAESVNSDSEKASVFIGRHNNTDVYIVTTPEGKKPYEEPKNKDVNFPSQVPDSDNSNFYLSEVMTEERRALDKIVHLYVGEDNEYYFNVSKGDILSSIAQLVSGDGANWVTLAEENAIPITMANNLKPDQKLRVPSGLVKADLRSIATNCTQKSNPC